MDEAHDRPQGTAGRAFRKHEDKLVAGEDYHRVAPGQFGSTLNVEPKEGRGGNRSEDVELLGKFKQALTRAPGGNNNPEGKNQHQREEMGSGDGAVKSTKEVNRDNITIDHPVSEPAAPSPCDTPLPLPPPTVPPAERGTSRAYAARRLQRDAPAIFERVKAGELSPHRAMVQAGLRKEPTPLDAC